MEKRWLPILGIIIVMVIAAISFLSIAKTTGSFVYGTCWKVNDISSQDEFNLKLQGCIFEGDSKICCPFEECPDINKIKCGD